MRTHTQEDLEFDLVLLRLYEAEGRTTYELATVAGLSQSQISRRLARARRYRQERDRREQEAERRIERDDEPDDLPFVALTSDPGREVAGWYDLDTDECSIDSGS